MIHHIRLLTVAFLLATAACVLIAPPLALAASAAALDRNVDTALDTLSQRAPAAMRLKQEAKVILVFPSIVKGGFVVGPQYGEGALRT
jgi:lipid-binding SYLF domain-containing protein